MQQGLILSKIFQYYLTQSKAECPSSTHSDWLNSNRNKYLWYNTEKTGLNTKTRFSMISLLVSQGVASERALPLHTSELDEKIPKRLSPLNIFGLHESCFVLFFDVSHFRESLLSTENYILIWRQLFL